MTDSSCRGVIPIDHIIIHAMCGIREFAPERPTILCFTNQPYPAFLNTLFLSCEAIRALSVPSVPVFFLSLSMSPMKTVCLLYVEAYPGQKSFHALTNTALRFGLFFPLLLLWRPLPCFFAFPSSFLLQRPFLSVTQPCRFDFSSLLPLVLHAFSFLSHCVSLPFPRELPSITCFVSLSCVSPTL